MTMQQRLFIHFLIVVAGLLAACESKRTAEKQNDLEPPSAEKVPFELTAHGSSRTDNYYWMKLSEAQRNANVKKEC